ncbi:hypothetical protein UlMin_016265 [Ulmus minor]
MSLDELLLRCVREVDQNFVLQQIHLEGSIMQKIKIIDNKYKKCTIIEGCGYNLPNQISKNNYLYYQFFGLTLRIIYFTYAFFNLKMSNFVHCRKRLFSLINDLPTVFEVVTERKPVKDKPMDSGSKSQGSTKRSSEGLVKSNPRLADESYEEEEDEHSETLCGSYGGNYNADEFWIGCDICEKWFHGKCVKITPAKAESIKQYKCPSFIKRGRQ